MSRASAVYRNHSPRGRGTSIIDLRRWVRAIYVLLVGALLCVPFTAPAADETLYKGSCGPFPPNSWFTFSSSTIATVHEQLVATVTERAWATYYRESAGYPGHPTPGCTVTVTPRLINYCLSPLDCTAQINGDVLYACPPYSSTAVNTFAIERGSCRIELAPPPKPKTAVVIDPGHGSDCPAANMLSGALGKTDFPASNPPAGRLSEDTLTVAIAQEVHRIFSSSDVEVILTKKDVKSCPSFKDRARKANDSKAKLLLSVHIDAANPTILLDMIPSRNGSLALYHRDTPAAKPLADKTAAEVSSRLGLNNRGSAIDARGLAILSPNLVRPPAAIIEVGRLSGTDEQVLHSPAAVPAAAAGIKSAIESFLATQP